MKSGAFFFFLCWPLRLTEWGGGCQEIIMDVGYILPAKTPVSPPIGGISTSFVDAAPLSLSLCHLRTHTLRRPTSAALRLRRKKLDALEIRERGRHSGTLGSRKNNRKKNKRHDNGGGKEDKETSGGGGGGVRPAGI